MSMNIEFVAVKGNARVVFNCWQTPTAVSREIMKSTNKVQAYKDLVLALEKHPLYKEEEEHIAAFEQWIKDFTAEGFTIKAELI